MKQIVRLINVDIPGNTQIYYALTKIKGISYSFSNAICNVMDIEKTRKIGELSSEEIKKIQDIIKNPKQYNIPSFLYNRRKDLITGEDKHLIAADLKLQTELDIKRLKRIKSYRGIRHALGLPVRGQRTKAHFRKGRAVGVIKKKTKRSKKA